MTEPDEIKADIERTRAEVAQTVGAIAAKFDPKEQARRRTHEARVQVRARYVRARESAPPQVQHALDTLEHAAVPIVAKAREDKRRTALIAGSALSGVLVLRRLRRLRRRRMRGQME